MKILNLVIFVFTSCITLLLLSLILLWLYLDYEFIPNLVTKPKAEYDFIIVGAGTAGSVLAYYLTKNTSHSVLLIEAGGKFNVLSKIPFAATAIQGTYMDYKFKTVPQRWSSRGLNNNQQKIPRGKGLGGTSQINYMLHFGGVQKDFHEFAEHISDSWKYANIKKFLTSPVEDREMSCSVSRTENPFDCEELGEDFQHLKFENETFPIKSVGKESPLLGSTFLESAKHLNEPIRLKLSEYNTKYGYRYSNYHTFLKPAFAHKNLDIMSESRVTQILFANQKVTGVRIENDYRQLFEIKAKQEIILSAGAIHSPQILKVSGVGPEQELKNHGIQLVAKNEMVGANLHDHLNMPFFVSINVSASVNMKKILNINEISKYIQNGTGIFSYMAIVGQGSSLLGSHGVILFAIGSTEEAALKDVANFKTETFRSVFPFYTNNSQEGFVMISTCHKPKSRGTVKISSGSVHDPPLIDPNYLEHEDDVKCILDGMKLSVEIVESEPFQKIGAVIHWPNLNACGGLPEFYDKVPPDDYLICLIRHVALTAHHVGGTCAMGNTDASVVDERLRVRGVSRLRVVDASVLPMPLSGTPNYIVSIVAKKAAGMILQDL